METIEVLKELREFRRLVSKARESCAGSNPKELSELIKLVNQAREFAVFRSSNPITCQYFSKVSWSLMVIYRNLSKAKDYYDRLSSDQTLCSILNTLDKRIKSLEE